VVRNYRDHHVLVHRYELAGQWGTHVDPPSHFVEGGRSLDQIAAWEMLCPLVILDISKRVLVDPDAVPCPEDVAGYEARWGVIPEGAFVALRTDWHRRWSSPAAFQNRDAAGVAHCPGWSLPVLRVLIEERRIAAIGHEPLDTDPGTAWSQGDFSLERYVLGQDCWQIEGLARLDEPPEYGAIILATWPKPEAGSGFPARAIAIHRPLANALDPIPEIRS
jgi:kynurenine formamidase